MFFLVNSYVFQPYTKPQGLPNSWHYPVKRAMAWLQNISENSQNQTYLTLRKERSCNFEKNLNAEINSKKSLTVIWLCHLHFSRSLKYYHTYIHIYSLFTLKWLYLTYHSIPEIINYKSWVVVDPPFLSWDTYCILYQRFCFTPQSFPGILTVLYSTVCLGLYLAQHSFPGDIYICTVCIKGCISPTIPFLRYMHRCLWIHAVCTVLGVVFDPPFFSWYTVLSIH
jgi:hypothetical protein